MSNETDTPRTDKMQFDRDEDCALDDDMVVQANFARELERELNAAKALAEQNRKLYQGARMDAQKLYRIARISQTNYKNSKMNQETDTPRTDAVMQTVSQFTGDVGITDLAKMHEHAEALERELNIARSLLMYAVFGVLKICGNSYVNACTEQWLEHAASLGAYPSDGPFIGKLDEVEARFEEWLETIGGLPDWPATPRQAARYAKISPTNHTEQP